SSSTAEVNTWPSSAGAPPEASRTRSSPVRCATSSRPKNVSALTSTLVSASTDQVVGCPAVQLFPKTRALAQFASGARRRVWSAEAVSRSTETPGACSSGLARCPYDTWKLQSSVGLKESRNDQESKLPKSRS